MKRRDFLKSMTALAAGSAVSAPAVFSPARAQGRAETLLIVSESGPNNLDIHGVGTNVPGYEVSWNCYDRLISHEMKTLPNGTQYYDRDKFKMELADDMNIGDMSATFKLREERELPGRQAGHRQGCQMVARPRRDGRRLPDLPDGRRLAYQAGAVRRAGRLHGAHRFSAQGPAHHSGPRSNRAHASSIPSWSRSKATEKDPWGLEYTKLNTAGSGAYKVTTWNAGSEVILERNDAWKGGPLPKVRRVIWRMVPSAGNRRALLERGDADISYDLPNKDFVELRDAGKLTIASTPYSNGIQYIGMNVKNPPFDKLKVRQAVAYAIPYQKIMDAVLFGLAKPMFGAPANAATEPVWPQPHKFNTDMAKAKQLLAEAGYPEGFETTLSFDLGFAGVNEPICVLTQESLAQIGIKTTINKIPGATWRTELNKKVMPLYTNVFSGWLDYPEYFFIWCYHGKNSIFNTMSYQSQAMDAMIDAAGAAATTNDKGGYEKDVEGFVDLAFADVPRIPLYQPYVNVAMQKNISGYQYWFHRRLDYRALVKG